MKHDLIRLGMVSILMTWGASVGHPGRAAEDLTGEQIYHRLCASCHGASGEGVEDSYPHPLVGERPLTDLTRVIDKTMPEGAPAKCVGEDAKKVAAFVYETFYSPTAQARNKPPRIELSRLTVRQYRETIADLIGTFRPTAKRDDERGLRGEYFRSRQFRSEQRVVQRRDAIVRFNFGEAGAVPEITDPREFAMRWQGSVRAPETGEYEFIVRTENGARLWVNDNQRPLVDVWVKSGSETEHRGSIRLLGGRVYPLRLEFFKSKEGKDKTASIALEWKLPHRAAEVIPARCLSANQVPPTFVVGTPFPPDDRSVGYERGTSISKAWDQATTDAALEVAGYVVAQRREFTGVADDAADRDTRWREFARRFAERAFRRPLNDEQRQFFIERQFAKGGPPESALKRVVLLVLKSPRFLYREAGGAGDGYDVASRLAFGLWDSLPDQPLLDAAAAGQLATREQLAQQAERLVADPRARAKLREFFLQWLKVEHVPDISKAPQRFPEFDAAVAADLRTSLDLFLEDVWTSPAADFRQFLLADTLYLNGRLAKFYGAALPADADFQKVACEAQSRAGVLSHPYLMAGFAYTATSSPIHRGVFVARSVLGRSLRPPPVAVAPLAPDLHAELTTRERVALQTKPEACQACHALINPLGFTMEHFDAVGRYRREEQGKPIDASGTYLTRAGDLRTFSGVRDLATFLADSEETRAAFVDQLFHYLVKQPIRAYGYQQRAQLHQRFTQDDCHLRKLAVAIVTLAALPPATP